MLAQSQRAVRGLRVQKLRCDEVEMFNPSIWEAAQLNGVRARIDQAAIGLIDYMPYSVPYEDLRLTH